MTAAFIAAPNILKCATVDYVFFLALMQLFMEYLLKCVNLREHHEKVVGEEKNWSFL